MPSRCVFYCSSGALALGLAIPHTARAGLGDGTGAPPAPASASTSDTGTDENVDSKLELAPAFVIGLPVGDYGSAVSTGFGVSVYAGYLIRATPEVRVAIGPALGYETYGAKGGDGSAGLVDITARARGEYDLPGTPGLTLFGDLGLGLGLFMVSVDGVGSQTQTNAGAFELGAGAAFHILPKLALTGELAYRLTPTNGDGAGRIALAIGGSYAY
jgi:hypothetical protein